MEIVSWFTSKNSLVKCISIFLGEKINTCITLAFWNSNYYYFHMLNKLKSNCPLNIICLLQKKTSIPSFVDKTKNKLRWLTTDRIQGDSRTSWCRSWCRGSRSNVGTGVTSPRTASWRQPGRSSGDILPPVDTSTIIIHKRETSLFILYDDNFFQITVMTKLHRKLEISDSFEI